MQDQYVTEEDLDREVGQLNFVQAKLALYWLATTRPHSEDGRALQRALAAVRRIENGGRS